MFESEVVTLPQVLAQWRIEVLKRGKYWSWRKGSHKKRVSRYGGKFETLNNERKEQYQINKAKYAARRKKTNAAFTSERIGTNGIRDVGERGELLPTSGYQGRRGEWG